MKVEDRLDTIEKHLAEIRATLLPSRSPRIFELKGLWKGLRISQETIDEAEKSLFKNASH